MDQLEQTNMELTRNPQNLGFGFIVVGTYIVAMVGVMAGLAFGAGLNRLPRDSQVQEGFIAPSKLEIKCEDLDGNGKKETIMKVGNDSYLLMEVDGKPVLSRYEIKPVEIVPKVEEDRYQSKVEQ